MGMFVPSYSAIIQLKRQMSDHSLTLSELPEIHSFLDGFYLSRIGIRILIGQHVSLHEEPKEGYIGAINTQCDPRTIAEHAIQYVFFALVSEIRSCTSTIQY
jgi:pyruvate dehydrogenase kinase 2/3/4